eukprot:jgi/Mesvir1/8827/Mv02728-RA.1
MLPPSPPPMVTLDEVMALRGVGVHIVASLPIIDRVRIRRTCRSFLSAVDESLLHVTQLFGDDLSTDGGGTGSDGLAWLMPKCPNVTALSIGLRADHEKMLWDCDRVQFSLVYPYVGPERLLVSGKLYLEDIADRYRGLRELNLAACKGVWDGDLETLARSCRGLESLDLSECKVGDEGIIAVARFCRGLRRLAVSNCKEVSDESLAAVARYCCQIQELCMDMSTNVSDDAIVAFVRKRGSGLRCLTVPEFTTSRAIAAVARHCPLLEHLGLQGCEDVSDAKIKMVAENCPALTRLDAGHTRIKDEGLLALVTVRGPGLRRLNLEFTKVTDAGISALAGRCGGGLEYLDVSGCRKVSDASIEEIARNCTTLRHLAVGGCPRVTDASVVQVAERCGGTLRALSVKSTGISDASIKSIADYCHGLRYLNMGHCELGDEESVVDLAEGCPELEFLDAASAVMAVAGDSLDAIGRYSAKLRVLGAEANLFEDKELAAFIKTRGGQLWEINVSHSDISDRTVALIAKHCPRLRKLNMTNCGITDESVRLLVEGCPRLQLLNVSGCDGVTNTSLGSIDDDKCIVISFNGGVISFFNNAMKMMHNK